MPRHGPLTLAFVLAVSAGKCAAAGPHSPDATPVPGAPLQSATCARPTDERGQPLYHVQRGTFVERKTDSGGGRFVVVTPPRAAGDVTVRVTQEVYDAVASLRRGRQVRLFSYVTSAASGADPPYSCVEIGTAEP